MHIPAAWSLENWRISGMGMLTVLYFPLLASVQAQSPSTGQDLPSQDVATNFQASLAVVIGVLSIMFLLTFILVVYAKFCHNSSFSNRNRQQLLIQSNSRFSGIDKKVIESLPFFKFSSLKGDREGLECAVCLSRFEEIEVLRLLPKCKHAFHINCVDLWLEKHSSCPLCRQRINENDLTFFTYSNSTSLRFPRSQSDLRDPSSNLEISVERAESQTGRGSSRFGSFRGLAKGEREEEVPIRETVENEGRVVGGYNHRIVVSEVVLNNRWSSVSSSDLVYLNSEMVNATSSSRFSNNEKFEEIKGSLNPFSGVHLGNSSKILNATDQRSMSEIIIHPRFSEINVKNDHDIEPSFVHGNSFEEDRKRRLWLRIARRTLQWFANRERRYPQGQNSTHSLNV